MTHIEAVCADGGGRVLLLQETPPRVELIDLKALEAVALIDLVMEGRDEIAQAWSDPKGSRGEGAVLLPGGHLLVAKEKKPAALIEFGPPHSRSRGLARGGALADGSPNLRQNLCRYRWMCSLLGETPRHLLRSAPPPRSRS